MMTKTAFNNLHQVSTCSNKRISQACELHQLTPSEQHQRFSLESKLKGSLAKLDFYEIGDALRKLLSCRLYRSSHSKFDQYCSEVFNLGRSQVYRYIYAASTYDNLKFSHGSNQQAVLPTTERQIRDLYNLEPTLQREVWQTAIDLAVGRSPSSRMVKEALLHVLIKHGQVQNSYSIGEVCQIIAKNNPQLKDKNGCWCIVKEIDATTCTCTVATIYGLCTLTVDHLKSLNYSHTERSQMQLLCDRLNRLYNRGNLEEAAISVLKQLGLIQRPYLLPLEEKLLNFLEQS